ncbi:MAG: hypothetical protein FJ276_20990 [Planctomycetes bacterium]|nr:hypothetical protein [Planctomycetota bacterium]
MFTHVLVATDLSAASERVLHCVNGLIPLGNRHEPAAVEIEAFGDSTGELAGLTATGWRCGSAAYEWHAHSSYCSYGRGGGGQ